MHAIAAKDHKIVLRAEGRRLRLAVVDDAVEAHDARPPRTRRRRDARLHEGLELGRGDPRHAARHGEAPLDLLILAFVLSWVGIICCFARWRGEGRFAKSTKEAPLAVVGKVFDEQPVSTKSFVFSEDTLTSVDEPPEASLVYADAPAVEVVVKTATARPLRGFGDGPA